MPSFDVVSEVNMQEVDNAINQAKKEISTRYDLKGTKCEITIEKTTITLVADDQMKLRAVSDILNQKMAKRGVGLRSFTFKDPEEASGSALRQIIEIKQGITTDDGRKMVKLIKEQGIKKVQAQIQQDQVRVSGPKRDDLQEVIRILKEKVTDVELQFVNFKE